MLFDIYPKEFKILVQFSHSVTSNSFNPMDCSMPGFPALYYLPNFAQTHVHWDGDNTEPSHPLCPLLLLPAVFPSIRVFSNESVLHIRWPKCWRFSFSITPSIEYSRLISFGIGWFGLLAVHRTLKSLLQHHSLKALNLRCSAFFMVQLSHPYMTTGKTITLTRRTFVSKVMSLFLNMLSRFVIAFLPRSKRLLISQLQSPSTLILEPKIHTKIFTWMIIAAHSNFQNLDATKMSPSVGEWITQLCTSRQWNIISVLNRNRLSSHEKTWKKFKCILVSVRSQSEKATYYMI